MLQRSKQALLFEGQACRLKMFSVKPIINNKISFPFMKTSFSKCLPLSTAILGFSISLPSENSFSTAALEIVVLNLVNRSFIPGLEKELAGIVDFGVLFF